MACNHYVPEYKAPEDWGDGYEAPEDWENEYEVLNSGNPPPEPEFKKGLYAYVDDDSSVQLPLETSKDITERFQGKLGVGTGMGHFIFTTDKGEVIHLFIGGVSKRNIPLDELPEIYIKLVEIFNSIQPGMEYENDITCCYRFVDGKLTVKHGINGCFGRDRLHGYEAVPEDDDSLVQEVLVPGLKNY